MNLELSTEELEVLMDALRHRSYETVGKASYWGEQAKSSYIPSLTFAEQREIIKNLRKRLGNGRGESSTKPPIQLQPYHHPSDGGSYDGPAPNSGAVNNNYSSPWASL